MRRRPARRRRCGARRITAFPEIVAADLAGVCADEVVHSWRVAVRQPNCSTTLT
ncbi:hypothetical protein [Alloactinosynnema sp. L-07]|nr:hypothetical protein [Alloactinosynnema sp. L-07]